MALPKALEERRQRVIAKRRDKLEAAAHDKRMLEIEKQRKEEKEMRRRSQAIEDGRDLTLDDLSLATLEMPPREKRYPWYESEASSSKQDADFGGKPQLMRSPSLEKQPTADSFRVEGKGKRKSRQGPSYELIKTELEVIWENPYEGNVKGLSQKRQIDREVFVEIKPKSIRNSLLAVIKTSGTTQQKFLEELSSEVSTKQGALEKRLDSVKELFRKKDKKGKGRALDPMD